jgi:hypothetical protein
VQIWKTIGKKRIKELPVLQENTNCSFEGYDALLLMSETVKLRNLMLHVLFRQLLAGVITEEEFLQMKNNLLNQKNK